ncbi:hypothetical protein NX059_003069 [Plenodomus lindquistii]|nr:hypothetical protein NX059_003069 [Plenodomus lindquistii]
MASATTSIQSHGGFPYHDMHMNPPAESDTSNAYQPQAGWASTTPRGAKSMTPGMDYLSFPMSNTPPPEDKLQLAYNHLHTGSSETLRDDSHDVFAHASATYTISAAAPQPEPMQATTFDANTTQSMYSPLTMFTASNAITNNYNTTTISPLQTRFDPNTESPAFNPPYTFQGCPQAFDTQNLTRSSNGGQLPPAKRRCDSPQTSHAGSSPGTAMSSGRRRRRSENAEPGSARAVYLEKNRKAASKCRSKQKMQQEELVETARDVERRNHLLKAEVRMLKGGIQELMEVVSQHNDCADGRLRAYIQREADRLASGTKHGPYIPPSPRHAGSTSSTGDSGSPTATTSSSRTW